MEIALRCYVDYGKKPKFNANKAKPNDSIVFVFDTETSTDSYQNLLFGSCGIWINGKQHQFYLFYDDNLKKNEVQIIKSYAKKHNYAVLSRKEFVEKVFYPFVYKARAKCVGFNLSFDVSRLGIFYSNSRKFPNGFSIKLSGNSKNPRIMIKSLNSKASFIEFSRNLRKKSEKIHEYYKGCFVDLRTATFALTNNSYALEEALKDFGCELRKTHLDIHGKITEEYIGYNVNDTRSTYELYTKVLERYSLFGLRKDISELFSPASIGKAYLEEIGIKPFLQQNPEFPKEILGYVMASYYGGRTEVSIRKHPVKIAYLDFTSMYPTVYVLLGIDSFLKAKRIVYADTTKEIQNLLDSITLQNIIDKTIWKKLTTICKIKPYDDILPVRSHYGSKNTYNIGLNYLKSIDDTSFWYSLLDLIVSRLTTGKTPIIERAITFVAEGIQDGLKDIEILKGITVKPKEDLIKKLIEERMRIKNESKTLAGEEKRLADLSQTHLKIVASSTSYGAFIEINTEESEEVYAIVHGLDSFETTVNKEEREGRAFNPIIAMFITAGARLILTVAEALVKQHNGHLAYCDTDSIFISPHHVKLVQDFFKSLNPYSEFVEMFKVEEDACGKLDNIWFYGISSKRYVLYDYNENTGEIRIRKYSSHGLGHLQNLDEEQWWKDILTIHYHPELKEQMLAKYNNKCAFWQLTVSNQQILKRFKALNKNKSLRKQIKPFNFVTVGTAYRQDPDTGEPIIPMLPYVNPKRSREIPYMDFIDYKTVTTYSNKESMPMPTEYYWKPLSIVLEDYINHHESKFDGDLGLLRRKHITINKNSIRYIGKESNNLEIAEILGVQQDDYVEYSNRDNIILNNKELILSLKPKDVERYGIAKEVLIRVKKHIRVGNISKIKKKTKLKLSQVIQHILS